MDGERCTFKRPGRPPATSGEHGTSTRYMRGCRCEPCRAAYSDHQRWRRERIRDNTADFSVSAEFAREHLEMLSQAGCGKRAVAACTGIDYWVIAEIRRGEKRRIRRSTEEKIMRVTLEGRADGSVVDAADTKRRLDELRALGFTLAELGRRLGYGGPTPQPQFYYGRRITALNASRVERLHKVLLRNVPERVSRMLDLARKVA